MTTTAHPTTTPTPTAHTAPVPRRAPRLVGLVRAELALLLRNRMQMFMAIAMPVLLPFALLSFDLGDMPPAILAGILGMMFVMALLFIVYYNVLSAYVARRQSLVLKRLRTGEASDATVLAATAAPALLISAVMILVMSAISIPLLDLPMPSQPAIVVLGLALGALVMVPLALLTANITRTLEAAQVTCLPFMMIAMVGAIAVLPIALLPEDVNRIAEFVPTAPISSLVRLGWLGVDARGAALGAGDAWLATLRPLAILAGWTVLAVLAVRRWFRWEPRG